MAKHRHHRRKRRVASPTHRRKHRRRRMSGTGPLYSTMGRHRKHRRRRRMGAAGNFTGGIKELAGLAIGGAVGDIAFSMLGNLVEPALMGMGLSPMGATAINSLGKVVTGSVVFLGGKAYADNNSFVKGLGLGGVVSGIREGVRSANIIPNFGPQQPMMSGPEDKQLYVVLPDKGMSAEKATIGAEKSTIGVEKSVIGEQSESGMTDFEF